MGTPGYQSKYWAAFDEANAQLNNLFLEYERLQQRKEQIEDALIALEPFLSSAAPVHEVHHPDPVITLPVGVEMSRDNSESNIASEPEPPVSARFVQLPPQVELDPIQRRINSALGLAVA